MREIRRKEREVTDLAEILRVMDECDSLCLALCDGETPYAVRLCFGYACDGGRLTLYFHSAAEGRKVELLQTGKPAAFSMDCAHDLRRAEEGCAFTMKYKSVLGVGLPRALAGEEKQRGLDAVMAHYGGAGLPFRPGAMDRILVFALDVTEYSCKANV